MLPENPAGYFIIVSNDRNPAAQRFDVDVSKRFLDFGVQEQIGTSVKVWHFVAFEGPSEETTWQQLRGDKIDLIPQWPVPGHHEERVGNIGDGLYRLNHSLSRLKRTHHQD